MCAQPWSTNGPTGKNILAITQSPTNSSVLYAGAFGWGVFKSSDAGSTWTNQKTGMTNTYVRSILALSDNLVFAGTNDGVFVSTNGGTSWTLSLATLNSVRAISYDATTASLYAGSFGTGLYKSTNQGVSWVPKIVTDPTAGETLVRQRAIAIFGSNSLYVGGSIGDIGLGGALFRSLDGGTTWIQVQRSVGIRSSVRSIAVSPTSPSTTLIIGTAALGVYRSSNGGANWSNIDTTGIANRLLDPQVNTVGFSSTQLYAGTDSLGKMYYRGVNDATVGWPSGSGLPGPAAVINAIKIDGTTSSIVYAGTEGRGVYKSLNSGVNWQAQNTGMLGIAGRVVKINSNGSVLLGTDFGDGIWKSSDHALTWVRVDSLPTSNTITSIGTTTNPSILYAGAYGSGVFRSTDAGVIWTSTDTNVISSTVRTLSVNPGNVNQVFAGTGNGVYRTDNGGISWLSVNNGIPTSTSIRSMAMDKNSPAILYAGTDSHYVYKTLNSGGTWTHITNANGFLPQDIFIRCITIDYSLSNVVYAGSDSGRVYKSTNAGSTWALLSQLPSNNSVRSILMHPANRKIFFAGTFGSGIFVSADSAVHWTQFNSGLSDLEIFSLESDNANPLNLYAGTGSSGVFHTTYTFVNAAPVLAPVGNQAVVVGQQLVLTISSVDPNATIPLLSVVGPPSGSAFVDSGNGRGRFAWSPSNLQLGPHVVTFFASDGSLSDSETVTITVRDTSVTYLNLQEEVGWNLISVPLVVNDHRKSMLFSTASSQAFGYHDGYVQQDTLQGGTGYWLKFPSSQIVPMSGAYMTRDSVDVLQGWNLIGSLSFTIPVGNARPVPPLTRSVLYGFSAGTGYSSADSVQPGKAYWVKASQAGRVVLDTSNLGLLQTSTGMPPHDRLTVTDASGQTRTLYVSSDPNVESDQYELPPIPPAGILDARFDTQRSIAVAGKDGRSEYSLLTSGAQFSLTMSWDISSTENGWRLEVSNPHGNVQDVSLQGKGEIVLKENTISQATVRFKSAASGDVPIQYSLESNYPNPFNPSTEIRYSLPFAGYVSLKIYNVLGELVATLVDGNKQASYQSALWNATTSSSGIYCCELRVTDQTGGGVKFRAIQKMVLLK